MRPRLTKILRRPWCGLAALTLFALAPKCVFCLIAYIGLATALGLGGRGLCGAPAHSHPTHAALLCLVAALVLIGLAHYARRMRTGHLIESALRLFFRPHPLGTKRKPSNQV